MNTEKKPLHFIEQIVENDLSQGLAKKQLRFRFPPEPNGYLHIGHTKAIGINFGLGEKYHAPVNLRFDDTNPVKEEQEYVDAIKRDLSWLGYRWDKELYASDYFQQLYDWAEQMVKDGLAFIDSQSSEAMALQKGSPTQKGVNSPYRNRSAEENLLLFRGMKNGEYKEGEHVLRAKIDMTHPNMLMRDPIMYRVLHKTHHRTGNKWCIYPMYDWAHGESDYIEQISHSLCSLEFKPHRELYNWFRKIVHKYSHDSLPLAPKQREFARLNLSYTIMSKRNLLKLVEKGSVSGWDDPRMPTISALRRRGYTPEAIKNFIKTVGVAKRENLIDVSLLEFCARNHLNRIANRVMAVLNPVKLVLTNYPKDKEEWLLTENNPEDKIAGHRKIPFSRELYIEKEDFKEEANRKFFRLSLGKEVRLKSAYIIKAEKVLKDAKGDIVEIQASYDPESLSGTGSEASLRKVKGTLHWVSANHALSAEVRKYDRLFMDESPGNHLDKDFMEFLNPNSLQLSKAYVEPGLASAKVGNRFQFQRLGYFVVDEDSTPEHLIFNKTVGLRDSWSKKTTNNSIKKKSGRPQNKIRATHTPIEIIKQTGKKLTNYPEEKQRKVITEILSLADRVSYQDIQPLLNTAIKKRGTRIAVALCLQVLTQKGLSKNTEIETFIEKARVDKNKLLIEQVEQIHFKA